MAVADLVDQAREALRLAVGDPGRAAALAAEVARQARQDNDLVAASIAERALGLAKLQFADLDIAVRHLRKAVDGGRRAASPQLEAEARMTLAYALGRGGRSRQALREIDTALAHLDGVEHARARAQRGAILNQLGRLDEALGDYRAALRALRRARDLVWMQRVLSNRAVLHGYRQEFAAAEADLHEAGQLCHELDLPLSAAWVQQNLGWVSRLRGDFPTALQYLDMAEQRIRALGAQLGEVLTDRSELLLSLNLVMEARKVAEQAIAELEKERQQRGLPEVRLVMARAATLDGDPARALHQAQLAVVEFTRQRRPEWATLARFVALNSRLAAERPQVALRQVERIVDDLVAAGWPAAAVEARLLAARLALDKGRTRQGCEQLLQASRARKRGPATLRAQGWRAEALLRLARQNRRGAVSAIHAGLRILDEHRAMLGGTDLRALASGDRTELAELGLRIALRDGQPRRVLAWAERGRAGHLLLRPVRPPDDPVLAAALAELRTIAAQMWEAQKEGGSSARLLQRQVAVERTIRDYCRRLPGTPTSETVDPHLPDRLGEALDGAALLEFIQLDGLLHAVTVTEGRVRLWGLGPVAQLQALFDRVLFALNRLVRHHADGAGQAAARALLRHTAARFDGVLLGPLAHVIGDRPLVLVPTGPLQSLPWSILPSCAGRAVTVSPSAALWQAASRPRAEAAGHVAVAAGPGLPGASAEAEAIATIHATTPLVAAAATVDAVTAALNGASLAHLAAHGHVRADNPLFSSLRLVDGPLTVYDLERLERVPHTVVLAACDAGRSIVCAGDELLGLSATFLSQGAQQLVASIMPVPDAETAPLMVAFHRLLAAGRPPAAALGEAQQHVAADETAAVAAAAGFVCIGAGLSVSALRPGAVLPVAAGLGPVGSSGADRTRASVPAAVVGSGPGTGGSVSV